MPAQEPGTRPACPVPYELACDGSLNSYGTAFEIVLEARQNRFGDRSSGAPFIAYIDTLNGMLVKHYAVAAGGRARDSFDLAQFPQGAYSVRVHGPNGFYRCWTVTRTIRLWILQSKKSAIQERTQPANSVFALETIQTTK